MDTSDKTKNSGEPSLVDRVLALHAGSRGFDSHRGHMSERFFRSNRPGYPHPVSSELENSGIRVAVGDCSATERRRWRPPYQTGTVHVHAKHYKHNEDGRTAPDVCGNGSVPLSHSGNVVTRIGTRTQNKEHSIIFIFIVVKKETSTGTDRFEQTMQTQNRLFLKNHLPGFNRLPFDLHLLHSLLHRKTHERRWCSG